MRTAIAGTAVLCLLLAQPASAAWQTSSAGSAGAKSVAFVSPSPITCTGTTVTWPASGSPTEYDVWVTNGGVNSFPATPAHVTTNSITVSGKVNVRVRAVLGSWQLTATTTDKICP